MIKHLFKMMVNRKKKNFFLLLQLFISFLAMFFFVGMNFKKFIHYFKPLNYNIDNVWVLDVDFQHVPEEKWSEYSDLIQQKLQAIEEADAVSRTNAVPFHHWGQKMKIEYSKQVSEVRAFAIDEKYKEVMGLKLLKGRWFKTADFSLYTKPVIVTKDMAEEQFKDTDPLGKTLLIEGKPAVVIGVSETFRENVSALAEPGFFMPLEGLATEFLIKTAHANNIPLMEDKIRRAVASVSSDQILVKQNISLSLLKNTPISWITYSSPSPLSFLPFW